LDARIAPCVVLLLSALVGANRALAQQSGAPVAARLASITGKVTASAGEGGANPLPGITVTLTPAASDSAALTTVTDPEGHYEFTRLAPGKYTIETAAEGFRSSTAAVTLSAGQSAAGDIGLQINSVEQQIEVREEATEVATESVSATATVSDQQLQELPLRTEKFTEALAISPGAIRTQEGKLNFNGQAESQGMLLVDLAENVDPVSGSFSIPIPVNAIQNIQVFNTPDSAAYGGFSGGLTRIDIKPPQQGWNYKLLDIVPSFRGKNDHLVGLLNMTPGIEVGGPLIKDKLHFSENMTYDFRKDPVHGLSWPVNETVTYSLVSFTQFQYTFSAKHLLNVNVNVFPSTILFANIDSLIPQTASASFRRRGTSVGASDDYQFDSGMMLTTLVRYTNFYNYQHGQGLADMTLNPEGWGGNYFNTFEDNANQLEALPVLRLPEKSWYGSHELQVGADVLYRSFTGSSVSRPIDILPEGCSLALLQAGFCTANEQIAFRGAGLLQGTDTEVAGFVEDRWTPVKSLAFTAGGRLTHQSVGRNAAFAPRGGVAYALPNGKLVFRAGAGLVFGHVPLLAADFAGYQERVITEGSGQPITLQNVYALPAMAGTSPTFMDQNSSARTFTWNLEAEAPLRSNLSFRLGYFETHTVNLFAMNPILPVTGTSGFLALENSASSSYRQAQITARYRPNERNEINISYAWSRARGDLNTLSETFLPVQAPVIRPNVYGVMPSDIPDRVVTWGYITLPKKFIFSPVADIHSGFPYSTLDVLQNYAGVPNSLRFPLYFSLDVKLSREFTVRNPFKENSKSKKISIGVFSLDVTNRFNPHDVFNIQTSPLFGQFDGFQRRLTGLELNLTQ
jgi:Carboxypeptidase regulatory-like domain/TonB dependent receptor